MEPFDPAPRGGKRKGAGRPQMDESGKQVVVTMRMPPALRQRLDWVYRNDMNYRSVSDVIQSLIEAGLPAAEDKIRKQLGTAK